MNSPNLRNFGLGLASPAQPWANVPGGFGESDLVSSAAGYRLEHVQVVLMRGVETWLDDPAWLAAATRTKAILRSK